MTKTNRVPAGVPTGGQFATEAKAENPDLGVDAPAFVPPEHYDLDFSRVTIGNQWRATGPKWESKYGAVYQAWASITPDGHGSFEVVVLDGMRKQSEVQSASSLAEAKKMAGTLMASCLNEWGCADGSRGRLFDEFRDGSPEKDQLLEWGGMATWSVYRPVSDPQWTRDLSRLVSTYEYGTEGVKTACGYPVETRVQVAAGGNSRWIQLSEFAEEAEGTGGGIDTAAAYYRVLRRTHDELLKEAGQQA